MGRPKKDLADPVSTRDKILLTATDMFAEHGFDAVSVRDITRALGLNEASLYNHFQSKLDLLQAILQRLEARLLRPGFGLLPPETYRMSEADDLAGFLMAGARRFFGKADRETQLTWRILMNGQYRYPAARDMVRNHLLDAPVPFFRQILEGFQATGRVRPDLDCGTASRVIASLFFDFSFRANLDAAWGIDTEMGFDQLCRDLTLVCAGFSPPGGRQDG